MKQSLIRRSAATLINSVIRLLPGVRIFTRSGPIGLYVRLNDAAVGAKVLIRGTHEPDITGWIKELLSADGVFVDVGANIGYHSLFACSLVGPGGRVIAIEPSEDNCDLIMASARRNGFDQLVLHKFAVADRDRVVGFQEEYGSNRQISLEANGKGVQATTLDGLLGDQPRIDVLKIDIEGAEGLALSAAGETLARCRPVIITEFFPELLRKLSGVEAEQYLDLLRGHGYTLHMGATPRPSSNEDILSTLDASPYLHLDLIGRPT